MMLSGKYFNLKNLSILLIIAFVVSLVPIMMVSFYSRPSWDDFSYGAPAHRVIAEGKGLFDVLGAAFEQIHAYYESWQGTYSAIFFMSLQPGIFGEDMYFLTTFFILLVLIGSTFFLMQTLLVKCLGLKWYYVVLTGVPLLFICMQYLPNIIEGFFWFNGAVFYTVFYGFMLLLLAFMIRIYSHNSLSKGKILHFDLKAIAGAVLCFLIGGGNYVTALISALFCAGFVVLSFLKKKSTAQKCVYIGLFLIVTVSLIISIAAPGTKVRQSYFSGNGVFQTILKAFPTAFDYMGRWVKPTTIIPMLLMLPLVYHIASKTKLNFKHPILFLIFSVCVYAAQTAPSLYAMGFVGGDRLRNILYYAFIWLMLLNMFYLCGWLNRLLQSNGMGFGFITGRQRICYFAFLLLAFLLVNYSARGEITSYLCASELYTGKARQIAAEMQSRIDVLNNPDIADPVFQPYSMKLKTVCTLDLETDPANWVNAAAANYYGKNTVRESDQSDN